MKFSLRLIYLYLFLFVGLPITVIGSIQITDLVLKKYVFRVADDTIYPDFPEPVNDGGKIAISREEMQRRNKEEQKNQQKRQLSNSLAMILVGVPLYLYH